MRRGGSGRGLMAKPPPKSRPRTASRVAAVQALFQSEHTGDTVETIVDQFIRHRLGELPGTGGFEEGRVPDADVKLFSRIVRTAVLQQDRLDAACVSESLAAGVAVRPARPRAARPAAGRRCGVRTWQDGPPARVVINEYLDVAHGFFTGDEPRMANGLLDRMARSLRAGDFVEA